MSPGVVCGKPLKPRRMTPPEAPSPGHLVENGVAMLLALLPALAFAGEISVILNAPGAVLIDGQRVEASGEAQ